MVLDTESGLITVTFKAFSKSCAAIALAGVVGLAATSMPAAAQTTAVPTADNPFGIPDNITIFGSDNPNMRTATAVVNGFVITGTDIDQRVALVTSASNTQVSDEERQRLRVQAAAPAWGAGQPGLRPLDRALGADHLGLPSRRRSPPRL